jgi:hypothetical protein
MAAHQVMMNAANIAHMRTALQDLSGRLQLVELAQQQPQQPDAGSNSSSAEQTTVSTQTAPATDALAAVTEDTLQDIKRQLDGQLATMRQQVSAELRAALTKEKAVIETTVGHKCESLVSKLVREKVATLKAELLADAGAAAAAVTATAAEASPLAADVTGLNSAEEVLGMELITSKESKKRSQKKQ